MGLGSSATKQILEKGQLIKQDLYERVTKFCSLHKD